MSRAHIDDATAVLLPAFFRPIAASEFRRRLGMLPLCAFAECGEPATSVVVSCGQPYDYCAPHGRTMADHIAARLTR